MLDPAEYAKLYLLLHSLDFIAEPFPSVWPENALKITILQRFGRLNSL